MHMRWLVKLLGGLPYRAQVYRANPMRGQTESDGGWRTRLIGSDGGVVFNQADRNSSYEAALALARSTGCDVEVNRDRPKPPRKRGS